MTEKITSNNTKLPVPIKYADIIGWKMIGLTYKQISERSGYSEDYLKHLFMKGGVLYNFRRDCVSDKKAEALDDMIDMAFAHAPDAMRANIIDAKGTGDMVNIAARKILFDYTLGKPEDRLKIDAKVGIYTFADWIKQQTLAKKDDEKSNSNNGTISTESAGIHESGLA